MNSLDDTPIEYFKTSFRGRPFRGVQLRQKDKYNIQYAKLLIKNRREPTATVIHTVQPNSVFVWRFDEEIQDNNSLVNINKILNIMECLS